MHSKSTTISTSFDGVIDERILLLDNDDKTSVSLAIATIDTAIEQYQQEQEEELQQQQQQQQQIPSSSAPLPESSECSSSITTATTTTTSLSKSVLTQIRNHLAQSLLRVKELENQVAQISIMKKRLVELESERLILMEKLTTKQNNDEEKMVKNSKDSAKLPEAEAIDQTKINDDDDDDYDNDDDGKPLFLMLGYYL